MSPEAQRIAIAEACGWEWSREDGEWCHSRKVADCYGMPPDYLNSLDAIFPAVVQLVGGDIGQDLNVRFRLQVFIRELMKLTSGRWAPDWPDCESYGRFAVMPMILSLSPDKISEALLKTLNLWTE